MLDAMIHPTLHELVAFGLGKLPERAAAVVAAHLESCPPCRKAVANVPPDSFLDKVRAARPDASSFPPRLAGASNAASSADRPAMPIVPCPDVPPELARHPKYLILRELGRGGMGVVYQARHKEMDRQVVIKVINRSLLDRPDTLERFHREVRAAALLSHPNIVTAYDAEKVGDSHMLVMEFVPGQSLAEVVQKKGSLPIAHACHFMRQVALGLQHAHERDMVHRDIKPQNLMLSLKNQIKILDFGLAKVLREQVASTRLTAHDVYMGTPDYCAPEQAQDARSADTRADLYSLGCTLYHLLSGRPPFREDTVVKTILAHQQKKPRPLPELRPEVPAELWQVVKRLLAKDPAKRYQKPIEVAQALLSFIKPGAKQEAKDGLALSQSTGAPNKGTVFELETSEVKKIPQDVSAKEPLKEVSEKEEASPFADLAASASLKLSMAPKRNGRKGCVLTVAVTGSLALTLILIAGTIIKLNVQPPNGDVAEAMAFKGGTREVSVEGEEQPRPARLAHVQPKVNLPADASVDDLRKALKNEDPAVQEVAAARLASLKDKAEPAKFALAETLTNPKTPTVVRRNAALALANIGAAAKPVASALAQALKPSEPLEVRQFVAEALAKMEYPANEEAIPAVLKAIENDTEPVVRQRCVWALFKMKALDKFRSCGADKTLGKLLDAREAKMTLLRYDAARKLAAVLGPNAPDKTVDVLLEMLANPNLKVYNGTDPKMEGGRSKLQENLGGDARFMAAQALGWLGAKTKQRPEAVEALRKAAKDDDDKLRKAAEEVLRELGLDQ